MGKQPPLIRYSDLSGTWYLITRYTQKDTHIVAHSGYKYDITDQIDAIAMPIVRQRDALLGALEEIRDLRDTCTDNADYCERVHAIAKAAIAEVEEEEEDE